MNTAYLPQNLAASSSASVSNRPKNPFQSNRKKDVSPERSLASEFTKMSVQSNGSSLRRLFGKLRSSSREKVKAKKIERGMNNRTKSMRCIPPLTRLAKNNNFDKISRILAEESNDVLTMWFDSCISANKGYPCTPLHVVLRRNPPVAIVDSICLAMEQAYPGLIAEDATDQDGSNALTVAVKSGCDFDIILRIISGHASTLPTRTMDAQKRSPLHWACIPVRRQLSKGSGDPKTTKAISTSTIRLLINAFPQARSFRDAHGLTPHDLAKKYLKKNARHTILDDLAPDVDCSMEFKGPSVACMSTSMATAMSTVADDIPREIFCIGDISHHRRRIEGYGDGGLDFADDGMDEFEQLEI